LSSRRPPSATSRGHPCAWTSEPSALLPVQCTLSTTHELRPQHMLKPEEQSSPAPRRGRRPEGDARRALIEAAQAILAARPAGKLTVREVASRAGCDVALVNYYFGSK